MLQESRDWSLAAAKAGDFVATFQDEAGGFVTRRQRRPRPACSQTRQLIDDQVQVARS
jgi:hypothetical protein